ncbi:MAG: hypothetical protein GC179_28060 [Anaerolineaceae bacterium]|nr:hypothetical protein [Anaerolineaceae bacterium]
MNEADTRQIIREFLETQSTLSLATVNAEGQPETAPVFYVSDDQFNLYWLSSKQVAHSINLSARPQVSGSICPTIWQWADIVGLQIKGEATAISDERIREQILLIYLRKFQLPPSFDSIIASSSLYVLRPSWMRWVNNSVTFGHKVEIEFDKSS